MDCSRNITDKHSYDFMLSANGQLSTVVDCSSNVPGLYLTESVSQAFIVLKFLSF